MKHLMRWINTVPTLAISLVFLLVFFQGSKANPVDGQVVSGSADIVATPDKVTIKQHSDQTVIDWRGFDIAPTETTQFNQPSSQSIAVNRVKSDTPSKIMGTLSANGNVVLINPNGIEFSKGSKVDVNSLVATTASSDHVVIKDGKIVLDKAGKPTASVINKGTITAKQAGLVGLVAPHVENEGVINAKLGKVHLAAGDAVTVDFSGENLVNIKVSDAVRSQLVKNTGTIHAEGGVIAMTAAEGKSIVDSLVHVKGELDAPSVLEKNGKIVITAAKGDVKIEGATLRTDGASAGGAILIGGDYQGKGSLKHANTVTIDKATRISASATEKGNGGKVIVWSDKKTKMDGTIHAKGGKKGGNGGLVETSSKGLLEIGGMADASALFGLNGEWLLDPADIFINNNADANITGNPNFIPDGGSATSYINVGTITTALDAGTDVIVISGGDGAGGSGDITVSSAITSIGNGDLTLSAYRNVFINAAIDIMGGNLELRSYNTGIGSGHIRVLSNISTHGGNITMGGGNGAITTSSGYANGNSTYKDGINLSHATINAAGGNVIINGKGYLSSTCSNNCFGNRLYFSPIQTTGSGTITLNGIGGGNGSSSGQVSSISFEDSTVTSQHGAISLNTYASENISNNYTLNIGSNNIISSTDGNISLIHNDAIGAKTWNIWGTGNSISTGGNIIYQSDKMSSSSGVTLNAGGSLTIRPYTTDGSATMGLGTGAGNLAVSSTLLSNMTASSYIFGSSTSGNLAVNTTKDFGASNLSFLSGGNITLSSALTKTSGAGSAAYLFQSGGSILDSGNISASSGLINLTFNADYDNNSDGYVAVNNSISTNGGNITMGGGSGAITAGSGYAVGNATQNSGIQTSAAISAGGGTIIANGKGFNGANDSNIGILTSASLSTTGSGNISLYGIGQGISNSGGDHGVYVNGNAISTANGTIAINGVGGGAGTGTNSYGVKVGALSNINTTGNGNIAMTGLGGSSNGNSNYGISLSGASTSITAAGAGDITMIGTGGTGTGAEIRGVTGGGNIQSTNGNITITATGGSNGTNPHGYINDTGTGYVKTIGTGNITITGISPTTAQGIYLGAANQIQTTGGGNVTLYGYRNSGGTRGIYINGTGAVNSTGNTALYADQFFTTTNGLSTTGSLTLAPYTANTTMGVGSGAGTLSYTDATLNNLSAGSYIFGSTTTGDLTINSTKDYGNANLSFISGSNISLAGSLTKASGTGTANYIFQANGNITSSSGLSLLASSGGFNLTLNSDYDQATSAGGYINLPNMTITTGGGNVVIGGGASPSTDYALGTSSQNGYYQTGSIVSGAGNVTIHGKSSSTNTTYGIYLPNTNITTTSGNVTIDGVAQYTGNTHAINHSGTIQTGTGNITLTGTNAVGQHGVVLWTGSSLLSTSGNIAVSGTGSTDGVYFGATTTPIITTGGNISFISDKYTWNAATINAGNTLTFAPYTAGLTMGLGSGSGLLSLTDTYLDYLTAGNYVFGSSSAGDLTISTTNDFSASNISFLSGGNISLASTLTKATGAGTANYLFQAAGNITNTSGAGVSASTGSVNLSLTSDFDASGGGYINLAAAPLTVNGGTIGATSNNNTITFSGIVGGNTTLTAGNGAVSLGEINGDTTGTRSLTVTAGTNTITTTAEIGAINKLNNLSLTSDDVVLGNNVSGSGTLTLKPASNNRVTDVNYGVADGSHYNFSTTEIGYLQNGWAAIAFGNSDNTGLTNLSSSSWQDPISFYNGNNLEIRGVIATTDGASLSLLTPAAGIDLLGGATINTTGAFTTSDSYIWMNGVSSITSNNNNISLGGMICVGPDLTINAGTGTLDFLGNVLRNPSFQASPNLTATASTMTFGGTLGSASQPLKDITLTTTNSLTLPTTTITGNMIVNAGTGTITTTGAINSGVGNQTYTSDDMVIGAALTGTGTLTLSPFSLNRSVKIANGSADGTNYNLTSVETGRITNGWTGITLGNAASTGLMNISTTTWHDPTIFQTSATMNTSGTITSDDNATLTFNQNSMSASGSIIADGNISINSANSAGYLSAGSSITTTNDNIIFSNNVLAYSGALTLNAGSGTITLPNGVNTNVAALGNYDFTATAGTFSLGAALGGSVALGNISLTSVNALSLPAITSTGNVSATVTGAGNAITTVGAINSGAGNQTYMSDAITIGNSMTSTGSVIVKPNAAATTMGLGTGAGSLSVDNTELGYISAGSYVFGSTTAGGLTISTTKDFGAGGVSLYSGGNIALDTTLTKATGVGTVNYLFQAAGNITNTSGAGVVASTGAINLTLTSDFDTSGAGYINLASVPLTVNGGTISATSNNNAISLSGVIGGDTTLTAGNGAVTLGAIEADVASTRSLTATAGTNTITTTGAIGATNRLNNLSLTSDDIALGGNVSGGGNLTLRQSTTSRLYNVNSGVSDGTNYNLSATEVGYVQNGWNGIYLGNTAGSANFTTGAATWLDPVIVQNNFRTQISGNLTGNDNASFTFNTGGSGWTNLNNPITTQGGNITFSGSLNNTHDLTTNGGNITVGGAWDIPSGASSFTLATSGGNIYLHNITETTPNSKTMTLNAGSGTIDFNGTVNANANLTATANTITTSGAWGATTALVDVTLNSDNIVLGGNLRGTGTLTLAPVSTNRIMNLNYGVNDGSNYHLSSTEIGYIQNGWNSIVLGNASSVAYLYAGTSVWHDNTMFQNNDAIVVSGTLSSDDNATLAFNANRMALMGDIASDGAINITTDDIHSYQFATWNAGARSIGTTNDNIAFSGKVNTYGGNLLLNAGTGSIILPYGVNTGTATNGTNYDLTATAGTFSIGAALGGTAALGNVTLTTNNTNISLPSITSTGNVSVNVGTGTITTTGAINSGAGNQTYTSDDIVIGGAMTGSGVLTLQPYSSARLMNFNKNIDNGTSYHVTTAELANLTNGWGGITIGSTSNHYINLGSTTWYDPITFRGFPKRIYGLISGLDNASLTFAGTYGVEFSTDGGSIVTNGNAINLTLGSVNYAANASIDSNGGNITIGNISNQFLGIGTYSVASDGGNMSVGRIENGILTSGNYQFDAGSGALSFTNTVNTLASLTANANTITTNGAWGGTTALSNVSLTSANSITLPTINASNILVRTTGAGSDITIASGKTLTATAAGNALTLASADDFINNAGVGALSAANGRWLVYSQQASDNTLGGLTEDFHRYSCTYGGTCPALGAGNGLLYSYTPTLTATTITQNVTYGDAATTSGYGYTLSGYLAGDNANDTVTGSLTGTSTYAAGSDVGTYNLNYSSGSLASSMGYGFTYANNASAIVVGARTITAGLTGTISKIYDGLTGATLGTGNYTLSNIYGTDDVTIATAAGTYDTANVGTGKTVSVTGMTLGGAKAGNYILSSTSASGAVGEVTARGLTITANDKTMTYGDGNTFNGYASSGLQNGETIGGVTLATNATTNISGHWNASATPWAITASGATGGTFDANNYSISYVGGALVINGAVDSTPQPPRKPSTPVVPKPPVTPPVVDPEPEPTKPTQPSTPSVPVKPVVSKNTLIQEVLTQISKIKDYAFAVTLDEHVEAPQAMAAVEGVSEQPQSRICTDDSADASCMAVR